MVNREDSPGGSESQTNLVRIAKGQGYQDNAEIMSATLEINLRSNASGVRLSSTRFTNGEHGVESYLVVSGEQQRAGFEPEEGERLRSYGDPQRALLILLLRAFGSQFAKRSLTTDVSPQLARSLVGILRKQMKNQSKSQWLSSLVGLQPQERLAEWFIGEGSASFGRHCSFGLSSKWRSTALVVKVNNSPTPVSVAEYEKLARVIEFGGSFAEPKATVTIDDFKLLMWNGALGCFARECDKVRHGDRVQLQRRTNQPVHLYILWLDQSGQVVTLFPWSGPNWNWPMKDVKVESLTIPDIKRDDEGNTLRVEGPAGVENILVLARRQPIDRQEAQTFQGMLEGSKIPRRCPRPEVLVVSKFNGTPRPGKQV